LLVPRDHLAVALRVADDPAQSDLERLPISRDGHGLLLGVAHFAVARSGRGAEIAERVPAFGHDQAPRAPVDQPDIDAPIGPRRPTPSLECPLPTSAACYAQEQFLHVEVAGVGQLGVWVARKLELQVAIEGLGQRKPHIAGCRRAKSQLQITQSLSADSHVLRERRLGQPSPLSARPQVSPQPHRRCTGALLPQNCSSRPLGSAHADDIGKTGLSEP